MADTSYNYGLALDLILSHCSEGSWSRHILETKQTHELNDCLLVPGIEIGTWHANWPLPDIPDITHETIIRINVGEPIRVSPEERLEKLKKLANLLSENGAKLKLFESYPYIAVERKSFVQALDALPY